MTTDTPDNANTTVSRIPAPQRQPHSFTPEPPPATPLFDSLILDTINFSTAQYVTPSENREVFRYWFYSIFFGSIMQSKPILALIGDKGSSKSTSLRRVGMLIYGKNFDVAMLPEREDEFDTMITNSRFLAIDNADTRRQWFEDKLAVIATGGNIRRRKLYTTNTVREYPIDCFLAITSRTPKFTRDDVADRLLVMHVDRVAGFIPESKIRSDVLENRAAMWGELFPFMQWILRALAAVGVDDAPIPAEFRIADFASFALRCAKYAGPEQYVATYKILKKMLHAQSQFTLDNDPIYELLREWITSPNYADQRKKPVTANDLCLYLSDVADSKEISYGYRGKTRSFAQRLRSIIPNVREFFDVDTTAGHGGFTLYRFSEKHDSVLDEIQGADSCDPDHLDNPMDIEIPIEIPAEAPPNVPNDSLPDSDPASSIDSLDNDDWFSA